MKTLAVAGAVLPSTFCIIGGLLFLFGTVTWGDGDVEPSSNSVPVTFESFLEHPPAIVDAEFEITNPPFPPEIIAQMKQTAEKENRSGILEVLPQLASPQPNPCQLLLDETNMILNRPAMGGYEGHFGSTDWALIGNSLRLVDHRINTTENDTGLLGVPENKMRPVKRLLNLGMESMVSGTVEWVKGADHFTAKCNQVLDGSNSTEGRLDVSLHYANGVPLTATTRDEWGNKEEITYKYDPAFFGGQLPVEFEVMGKSHKELFSLQIKKLQLPETHFDSTGFDPRVVLKGKYAMLIVESNNISYGVSRRGIMRPVISAEEAQQKWSQRPKAMHANAQKFPLSGVVIRVALVAAVVALLIVLLMRGIKQQR